MYMPNQVQGVISTQNSLAIRQGEKSFKIQAGSQKLAVNLIQRRSQGWGWVGICPTIKFVSCPTIKTKICQTSDSWQHINNTSILEHLLYLITFYFLSYYIYTMHADIQ